MQTELMRAQSRYEQFGEQAKQEAFPLCPVCAEPMTDLYPKPRCRKCGYLQSCCNPDMAEPCAANP